MLTGTLFERALDNDWLAALDPPARRLALRELLTPEELAGDGAADVVARVADHIDGYGPLTEVMARPGITDVLVNGLDEVWAEEAGRLRRVDAGWDSVDDLRAFVDRLLARGGVGVDPSRPVADARLPDGSRVHVVLPPVAPLGPLVSIRRFPSTRFTLDDLAAAGMVAPSDADLLRSLVADRVGIAVSGGTGAGKTTLLNALVSLVDAGERVVTLEETPELGPFDAHVVSLVTRPPNLEGAGAVDLSALVRASLRMRPDRIVVGEVRGDEAAAALAAMATGHDGSMITLHARSAGDAPARLADLANAASPGATAAEIERRVRRALGAFVHVVREGGVRRVTEVVRT